MIDSIGIVRGKVNVKTGYHILKVVYSSKSVLMVKNGVVFMNERGKNFTQKLPL